MHVDITGLGAIYPLRRQGQDEGGKPGTQTPRQATFTGAWEDYHLEPVLKSRTGRGSKAARQLASSHWAFLKH
jgi:hypothetical protein